MLRLFVSSVGRPTFRSVPGSHSVARKNFAPDCVQFKVGPDPLVH